MGYVVPVAVAFVVVYLSVPFFRGLAYRYDIVDEPGGRKIHHAATPLLGGIAIYAGMLASVWLAPVEMTMILTILTGATGILMMGLIDDARGLSAQLRLVGQAAAAFLVVFSGIRVNVLPDVWWGILGEIVITFIWIIGVTNAFNFLDGMDGLAAGSAAINFSGFGLILAMTGQTALSVFSFMLAAACVGFLPHNFGRNKIFLGDAGSTFLGFTLACVSLAGHWAADNIVKVSIPVLILGVPIFDMTFTTIMRVREGKVRTFTEWLTYGGKDHFHHYLVDVGFVPKAAVAFIYWVTFSLTISAIMISNDRSWEAFLAILQSMIVFGVIAQLMIVGRRRRSGWNREGSGH